ncbi:hypothetical protein [Thalassobius sp. Cn5-15]|uniref:hypothetical protein n=1 Tax=Thalassobius sp. Cn5-15 TaxID=2917763 RepID=UPI001EF17B75|nr:hypothetical protein [Thalassobius sp. Cn5-15]MCG7492492.1 hypothetical protein [Thalassobius sp. Cn5-15]
MTEVDDTNSRKTVFGWLAESKPTDWLTVGVSIVTLLVTLNVVKPAADQAKDSANEAVKIATETGIEAVTVEGVKKEYVVQLASYQRQNCSIAQEELNSYASRFETSPALFETADNRFIVIGVEAENEQEAIAIQELAFQLSELPEYSKESLDQARRRHDPNWKKVSC